MQLQLKTVLNHVHPLKSFVYSDVRLVTHRTKPAVIRAVVAARQGSKARCSGCMRTCPGYDHLDTRFFQFVPLWGLAVFLLYAPRRVDCPRCERVLVEHMPWAHGKSAMTTVFMSFLSTWARRMSWTEVTRAFGTSWQNVATSVEHVVAFGLEHRSLDGVSALGVDEIMYRAGHKYLTLVYQIDTHSRRLLWITESRTTAAFKEFFTWFGAERSEALRVVCSDMWAPYLTVIKKHAPQALNILDKFHIVAHLNKAVDETRRRDAAELGRQGDKVTLKHSRWCLLKRTVNLTKNQRGRLRGLLRLNLGTIRAYLLKEEFIRFWTYKSPTWAGKFLDQWCDDTMRSGIEPMKSKARMLRKHRDLILNYFVAKKQYSSSVVEGLNNKVRTVTRRAFGFRQLNTAKLALFHTLGRLPEPEHAHRFA